jgi:hypothetical protein
MRKSNHHKPSPINPNAAATAPPTNVFMISHPPFGSQIVETGYFDIGSACERDAHAPVAQIEIASSISIL